MRRLPSLVLVLSLSISAGAAAQGTLIYSQNKCAIDKQDQIHRIVDSVWVPVLQELVNEGKLMSGGSAYHNWGDEWNVVLWYVAPNIPTFLSAANELVGRVNQRHPTVLAQFTSWCTEHKDSFLAMGKSTAPAPPSAPRRP